MRRFRTGRPDSRAVTYRAAASAAGGICFAVLSVVFRGDARHAVAGQLCRWEIGRQGRSPWSSRERSAASSSLFRGGGRVSLPPMYMIFSGRTRPSRTNRR